MKAAQGFLFKQMKDMGVIVPVGKTSRNFRGMVTLNESGSFLWKLLTATAEGAEREALVDALTEEYEIDRATAERDVDAFLTKLREAGLLENEP